MKSAGITLHFFFFPHVTSTYFVLPRAGVRGPGLQGQALEAGVTPKQGPVITPSTLRCEFRCPLGKAVPSPHLANLGPTMNAALWLSGQDGPPVPHLSTLVTGMGAA